MPDVKCSICKRDKPRGACVVLDLTKQEQEAFVAIGDKTTRELAYCRPCWKVISDPNTGTSLMKGLLEIRLRQLGVSNAEGIADRYRNALLSRTKRKSS